MENRNINLSFTEHAVRLDLISKVKGAAAAENYFHSLPATAKNRFTYGALLNCYSKEAMEDKALLLFKEMEELGFTCHTLPYNNIMSLYMRKGKLEKIPSLVEEMKERNISLDSFTYNIWMQSYACSDDIDGVEKVFHEMLEKDAALCDWTTYSNLAAHYVKAGLTEKAEGALKKLESVMDPANREAYHYLITLYAGLSNLTEVCRVWDSLKAAFQVTINISYLVMLGSLRRLKDLEGLRKVFEEWQSNCTSYDVRVVKIVIGAYLDQDRLEEAEAIFKDASTRASRPFLSGMELFMVYFLRRGCLERCMEFLEAALSISKNEEWIPLVSTIDAFLLHFEGNGDVKAANELFNLLKEVSSVKSVAYNLLLRAYVAAGKTDPEMRRMMDEDGVEIDDELKKLLQKVCPS
ncbi:pentatricopeptide repeat-containing protein At1g02370, mitochondrial-like isoform X2 [Punica granatum]|nr:pentatricopeptide repeat-containing protein At1g02370, mitochondrial-like isoform X2 [Punica granatum]